MDVLMGGVDWVGEWLLVVGVTGVAFGNSVRSKAVGYSLSLWIWRECVEIM